MMAGMNHCIPFAGADQTSAAMATIARMILMMCFFMLLQKTLYYTVYREKIFELDFVLIEKCFVAIGSIPAIVAVLVLIDGSACLIDSFFDKREEMLRFCFRQDNAVLVMVAAILYARHNTLPSMLSCWACIAREDQESSVISSTFTISSPWWRILATLFFVSTWRITSSAKV